MLLADFHVHSTWSDGRLSIPEIVDLFGRTGHEVVAVTDHVVNEDTLLGRAAHGFRLSVNRWNWNDYRAEIAREAGRAWDRYRMVLLAGNELTRNGITGNRSAHALALGLETFVSAEGSIEDMLTRARDAGAVTVACHPNEQSDWFANTFYLWKKRREIAPLIDRWELACRWDLFPQVARARLAYVANSDFHDRPHLFAWKTLLDCDKTPAAVLAALRSKAELGVTRMHDPRPVAAAPAAATAATCGFLPGFAEA